MIPFLRKGNYFGVEPNEWLIKDGIKNELGNDIISIKSPSFSNSSSFELQSFNEKFDFLIAQSIFSHASSSQIIKCLKEAKSVMSKEALFFATFIIGEDNYTEDEWVYPGCVTYQNHYVLGLIKEEGLAAIKTAWSHPNGQSWYLIFHPENEQYANKIAQNCFQAYPKQ